MQGPEEQSNQLALVRVGAELWGPEFGGRSVAQGIGVAGLRCLWTLEQEGSLWFSQTL